MLNTNEEAMNNMAFTLIEARIESLGLKIQNRVLIGNLPAVNAYNDEGGTYTFGFDPTMATCGFVYDIYMDESWKINLSGIEIYMDESWKINLSGMIPIKYTYVFEECFFAILAKDIHGVVWTIYKDSNGDMHTIK